MPMLEHTVAQLLQGMRMRAQLAEALFQRVGIIWLFVHEATSDISFTLGSHVLRLPESAGYVLCFHYEKTLWKSVEALVVLTDAKCPRICAFGGVTEYVSAALGWD